jgi:uncharacterized protein YegP (UPF0339 family)
MGSDDIVEFYRAKPGLFKRTQWRWRVRDGQNGKIIAMSSEGYNNREECVAMSGKAGYALTAGVSRYV